MPETTKSRSSTPKRRKNRFGTISLSIAAAGFAAANFIPWPHPELQTIFGDFTLRRALLAFFDASMVGALADWFAVSALFRNPLGIRLPHTDVLAKNKDALAEAVPRFLTGFVSNERIAEELAQVDLVGRGLGWLSRPGLRDKIHTFIQGHGAAWLARPRNLAGPVAAFCGFIVKKLDMASALSSLLRWAKKDGLDDRLVRSVADLARKEMERNHAHLVAAITPLVKRNAGWQGIFINAGNIGKLLRGLEEELGKVRTAQENELRSLILDALVSFAARMDAPEAGKAASEERTGFLDAARQTLLSENFQSRIADFADDVISRVSDDLGSSESSLLLSLVELEDRVLLRLASDAELRGRVNAAIAGFLSTLIVQTRIVEGLSSYVSAQLKKTDRGFFVGRVEEAVWNDLQFIRVNGAVVGGLVGLVLSALTL